MFSDLSFFNQIFAFVANLCFLVGFIYQIILNYKLKTTKGLSTFLVIGNIVSYLAYIVYVFCFKLPLVYQILIPLCSVSVFVIMMQWIFYDLKKKTKKYFNLNFLLAGIISYIFVFFLANKYPSFIGNLCGLSFIFLGIMTQLPQIFNVQKRKSVKGFSLFFILMNVIAFSFESMSSVFLHLPVCSLFNSFRGLFLSLFFLVQFLSYETKVFNSLFYVLKFILIPRLNLFISVLNSLLC